MKQKNLRNGSRNWWISAIAVSRNQTKTTIGEFDDFSDNICLINDIVNGTYIIN